MTDWDEVAKEADLLKIADAVGVYRSGPVELGNDTRVGDTTTQRTARQRQAARRADGRHRHGRDTRALDRHLGIPSPYPEVATTYPRVSLRADTAPPTDEQVREAANDLCRQGWPTAIVAKLLNIQPRS